MKTIKIFLLLSLLSFIQIQAFANDKEIFSVLSEKSFMNDFLKSWEVERVDYGLHYFSKEKIKNPKGQEISAITIDFEGPVSTPDDLKIEDSVNSNIKSIINSFPINQDFKPSHPVDKGIGATIVDINGQKAGFIEYEVKAKDNMIYGRHCLILKDKKLYTFTMVFYDQKTDRKKGMALEVLAIAAVNSGKL